MGGHVHADPFVPMQRLRRITIKLHLLVSPVNFLFSLTFADVTTRPLDTLKQGDYETIIAEQQQL